MQVWDSNTYLGDELIGEVKINLDVFLRKKGAVKVKISIRYFFKTSLVSNALLILRWLNGGPYGREAPLANDNKVRSS